jgi:hypothetical protein
MKAAVGFALLFAASNAEVKHVSTSKNLKVSKQIIPVYIYLLLACIDSKRQLFTLPIGGLWQQRPEHRC